jgi:gallate decarboxylase subunit D
MITSGRGKYKVWLQRHSVGADLVFFLGGGQRSHIGGMVIAQPGKKVKIIKLTGHYDDIVLQPIAEAACKKYKTKVVAVGGVHVDHATKQEIDLLVKNCKKLVERI